MKRFLAKASKPFVIPKALAELGATFTPSPSSAAHTETTITHVATVAGIQSAGPSLQPKYTVPAVPHPCPYDHLALLACKGGLLIRRHIASETQQTTPHVRIAWGKSVKVEEIKDDPEIGDVDWDNAVVVYGIIGILELFSASYLLVITSRAEVGNVIDGAHTIYRVKGVTAIPLVEEQARITLNTLASQNALLSRPSLFPVSPQDPETELDPGTPDTSSILGRSGPRVQFSTEGDQVKLMTPVDASFKEQDFDQSQPTPRSSSPLSFVSETSTVSEGTTTPSAAVARAVTAKLSFWTSKLTRTPTTPITPAEDEHAEVNGREVLIQAQESLDKVPSDPKAEPAAVLSNILNTSAPPPASVEDRNYELDDKIVRECIREYTKGGMYFAYNFDITRSLQHKQEQMAKAQKQHDLLTQLNALPSPEADLPVEALKTNPMGEPHPTLPLWRRVDRKFWWNEWLSKSFVDAGLHPYVLPVMQGYCQIAHFIIPPDPLTHDEDMLVDYAIISRRSKYRAGLRYQRRGIDEDANVANFVETETIMRVERLGAENIFAFVQIRGSIPLYWTQTGYGLKPPPVLAPDRSRAQNLDAIKRHFHKTIPLYGPHTVVNLAEQQGKEGPITQNYREYMSELDSPDANYHEYDFHTETKGMKYENISKLVGMMDRTFDTQGYLWISDNMIMSNQKGVFRVNCIDCLDRTNVVQSAFARHVLNKQLGAVALHNPQSEGRAEIDIVFNDVWANNGDAISRAYAGTSALKGDFTRTGKRDLSGLLNDGVNSLARMYTSTFSDWFSQAVIDFMLGNRTITVFSEFLLKLQSTDPRDLIRLSKIRAEAIATSVSRVLPEGERLLSGWTLFAPSELNTKIGDKFEEKVLLLSARALYIVSYDYTLEKVKIYTRVPLGDIIGITKGAYILSPLEEASRDPAQNAGFVVTWHNTNQTTRVSSYSVRNTLGETTASVVTTTTTTTTTTGSVVSELADATTTGPSAKKTFSAGSINTAAVALPLQRLGQTLTRGAGRAKETLLSNILSNAALAAQAETTFAAFKVLPIDPARVRMASSTSSASGGGLGAGTPASGVEYTEAADELSGATSCQEAVEIIVDCVRKACEDVGGGHGNFVGEEDVVSLAEAQRMTGMYARMEYGVKRLLWLGG